MAELTAKDRLQPALLDRLTDDAPSTPFEARERRVVSAKQLRRGVLRDLSNLLNATRLPGHAPERGDACPAIARSVLNYGLPDFTGKALSNLDSNEISDWIAEAIRSFEPRIVSDSVRVRALPHEERTRPTAMAFLIEGDLWMQPYPERLYFRTELDVEDGDVSVRGLDGSSAR
jgi:type VI secretion system protein ImpF